MSNADLVNPAAVRQFITLIHERAAAAIAGVTNARPSVLHLCSAAPSDTRFYTSAFNIGDTEYMIEAALIEAAAGKNVFVEGRLVRPGRPTERGGLNATLAVFASVADSDSDTDKPFTACVPASAIVETSPPANQHNWYFLKHAIGADEAMELGALMRQNGGDHCSGNPVQPYRCCGTPNFPNKKKIERGRTVVPTRLLFAKTAYLLHQFKRKEEIDLLRSVYGRLFFQVSIYSRRGSRVDYLSRKFASSENKPVAQNYRDSAEALISQDENQIGEKHGQRVASIFHDADFIVSTDAHQTVEHQVNRFCELIFGSNIISPTKLEYGLFAAKAAALRTLDLSRQVGAAIFSPAGEVIAVGSNEVPKAGGGTYWCDDPFDDRDFVRGRDPNDDRKREIFGEIVRLVAPGEDPARLLRRREIRDSQLMDMLEYGRVVHAEMSALTDAARCGHSVREAMLFCTTFPCHICAKHIVASGISRVIFLEPYPKSLAFDLHADSIQVEGGDRGHYSHFPAVQFEHFYGVSPRRYREIFEWFKKRKTDNGVLIKYCFGQPRPIIDIKFPFYSQLESHFSRSLDQLRRAAGSEARRRVRRGTRRNIRH